MLTLIGNYQQRFDSIMVRQRMGKGGAQPLSNATRRFALVCIIIIIIFAFLLHRSDYTLCCDVATPEFIFPQFRIDAFTQKSTHTRLYGRMSSLIYRVSAHAEARIFYCYSI